MNETGAVARLREGVTDSDLTPSLTVGLLPRGRCDDRT